LPPFRFNRSRRRHERRAFGHERPLPVRKTGSRPIAPVSCRRSEISRLYPPGEGRRA